MKRSYIFCMLIFGLLWAGCSTKIDKKPDAPADLIHRDTMVNIIADLTLMDAIVFFEQRQGTTKTNEISYFIHNSIMEKYHITRDRFERSFVYYQHDLAGFDKIMADVITRLTILKTETEKE
ncbi:MAG: DUF4296 domain-containing protein [Bacteroidales bacterium]